MCGGEMSVLGGDIELNPGSVWICDIFGSIVKSNQYSIQCNSTQHWVHLRCSGIPLRLYNRKWRCVLHHAAQTTVHPPPASIRITRTQPQIRNSTTNTQNKSKEHSFLQININGIQGKIDELAELVTETKPTLIAVQETKLQHRNKTATIASYTACRRDPPSEPFKL